MRPASSYATAILSVLCACSAFAVSFQTAGPIDATAASDGLNAFDRVPRIATDGTGHWVAVWETSALASGPNPVDLDIAVSRSTDNGATWTAPAFIAHNELIDDAVPCIATDGDGNWVCAYTSRSLTQPYHRVVQTSKSTDNGATWDAPVDVNPSDPNGPYSYAPSIAADGNGHWILVWDTTYTLQSDPNPITGDDDIGVSTSSDGETWTAPARVNSASTTDVAADIQPKVATDGSGVWVCVWRSNIKSTTPFIGDDEIYFAKSTNNGATWTAQSALNAEFDTEAFDDERPSIATDGNGNWIVAWEANEQQFGVNKIWVSVSNDDGTTWTTRTKISDNPDPFYTSLGTDIATDGNRWIVVWNQRLSNDYDIAKSESTDAGNSWSTVQNVNSNAGTDLGNDWYPSIATDNAGHWIVAWGTEDTDNGDQDVWRAISGGGGGAGTLTLTAPNGGEKWKIGKKKKIEWTSMGNVGADVKLELLRNGSFVQNIKASTKNDGQQKWKLPNSLAPGNGYKVRISDKSNGAVSDVSDGSLKIKSAK